MRSAREIGDRRVQVAAVEVGQRPQGHDAGHLTARLSMGQQGKGAQAGLEDAARALLG
ncbi:MAG: hypothetical protein ACLQVF_15095 [Isosphaeraceae bacterium]